MSTPWSTHILTHFNTRMRKVAASNRSKLLTQTRYYIPAKYSKEGLLLKLLSTSILFNISYLQFNLIFEVFSFRSIVLIRPSKSHYICSSCSLQTLTVCYMKSHTSTAAHPQVRSKNTTVLPVARVTVASDEQIWFTAEPEYISHFSDIR